MFDKMLGIRCFVLLVFYMWGERGVGTRGEVAEHPGETVVGGRDPQTWPPRPSDRPQPLPLPKPRPGSPRPAQGSAGPGLRREDLKCPSSSCRCEFLKKN